MQKNKKKREAVTFTGAPPCAAVSPTVNHQHSRREPPTLPPQNPKSSPQPPQITTIQITQTTITIIANHHHLRHNHRHLRRQPPTQPPQNNKNRTQRHHHPRTTTDLPTSPPHRRKQPPPSTNNQHNHHSHRRPIHRRKQPPPSTTTVSTTKRNLHHLHELNHCQSSPFSLYHTPSLSLFLLRRVLPLSSSISVASLSRFVPLSLFELLSLTSISQQRTLSLWF